MLLAHLLSRIILKGSLNVIDATGKTHVFGDGATPRVIVRLHDPALHHRLFFRISPTAGDAYMDGTLVVEEGDIYDLVSVLAINTHENGMEKRRGVGHRIAMLLRCLNQRNTVGRARHNVARHYDLSGTLYDLFLDRDRQYSCAYYTAPTDDLETAQEKKKRHIAAKLLLKPGQKLLDIGSGWGGLGIYLATAADIDVTGVTLSAEQHEVSTRRSEDAGMADRVRFLLHDYRNIDGTFDRIVSVGMFEHVGARYYPEFFAKARELLSEDGVMLLHTIGRADGPGTTDPWICKHIFPGGYSPALSEVAAAIEKSGLWITDVEILRLHYAETLREWRQRFHANMDKAKQLYDERFCRMWDFYLAASEASFRYMGLEVFQLQITRRQESAPLTRDYMMEAERSLTDAARPSRAA